MSEKHPAVHNEPSQVGGEPITSKQPYHPTTQGKNERFGQTLFRYLDQQPLATFIAEPQRRPRPSAAHHRPGAGRIGTSPSVPPDSAS